MRALYTLDVERIDDDIKFNPSGKGYRVAICNSGLEIGDGYALTIAAATIEALREAGLEDCLSCCYDSRYCDCER